MQKVLIVGGVILMLLVVSFIAFFIFGKKRDTVYNPPPEIPARITYPPGQESRAYTDNNYSSQYFSLIYPAEYEIQEGIIQDRGVSLSLTPPSSLENHGKRILVQVFTNGYTREQALNYFKGIKFKEQEVIVSGVQATRFTGVFNPGPQALQESGVVFEKNGRVYQIDLSYAGESQDSKIENEFTTLLESFTAN